jgi:D-threo-aldose 1-dehydrogenase
MAEETGEQQTAATYGGALSSRALPRQALPRRTLGRSGLEVSILGFGGAPIGDLYTVLDEAESIDTIVTAVESGINFLDTSPLYGHGLSEHRIGAALRRVPDSPVVISSKVGRTADPFSPPGPDTGYAGGLPHTLRVDYSYDGAMRSMEQSLLRLGRDHIDIVLVHDLDVWTHGDALEGYYRDAMEGAVMALEELRSQKVISGYGVGVNEADKAERFARDCDPDAILLAGRYSLLEQPALESFLPLALERDIGVILGGVFNSGILATGPVAGARYNYQEAPPEILDRVSQIDTVCKRHSTLLRRASLQFVLGHPAVSCLVLGAVHPSEVISQVEDLGNPVPADLWSELQGEGLLAPDTPVPS